MILQIPCTVSSFYLKLLPSYPKTLTHFIIQRIEIEIMIPIDDTSNATILYNIIEESLNFTDRVMISHSFTNESFNKMEELIDLLR